LIDGDRLYVIKGRAWCHSCKQVVAVEYVPSVEHSELELRAIATFSRQETSPSGLQAVEKVRAHWELRRSHAFRRKSPGRCLECGSVDISPKQPSENAPLFHPGCGGELRLREWAPEQGLDTILLDEEGRRL
jgi:hypothetical protein